MRRFSIGVIVGVIGWFPGMGLALPEGRGAEADDSAELDAIFDDNSRETQVLADAEIAESKEIQPADPIDYFAKYEATYIDRLTPPEENGMREVLAALGPMGMGQHKLAQQVPWNQFATNERSREWFHETWVPACKSMGIEDPFAEPAWLGFRTLEMYLKHYGITGKEPPISVEMTDSELACNIGITENENLAQKTEASGDTETGIVWDVRYPDLPEPKLEDYIAEKVAEQFSESPWTAADSPIAARWLEDTSPFLDLWSEAVRKPNFCAYVKRAMLLSVTLPEYRASKDIAQALQTRAMARIAMGTPGSVEIDQVIDDIETLLWLSRKHYQYSSLMIIRLVGVSSEWMGQNTMLTLLRSEKCSPDQLERLARMIESLDPPEPIDRCFEGDEWICQDALEQLYFGTTDVKSVFGIPGKRSLWKNLAKHVDLNLVRAAVHEQYACWRETILESDEAKRIEKENRYYGQYPPSGALGANPLTRMTSLLSVQKCSKAVAETMAAIFLPSIQATQKTINMYADGMNLLQIGVAIEQYRLRPESNGRFPETLEELVDTGLLVTLPVGRLRGFVYSPDPFVPPTQNFERMKEREVEQAEARARILSELKNGAKADPEMWEEVKHWLAEEPDDEPLLPVPYTLVRNRRESPFTLYCFGSNGQDDTATWNHADDDGLGDAWLQNSDDLRL